VLRLLAEGKGDSDIGEALFISGWNAGTHVTDIFANLNVNSRAPAVGPALNHNLI
jgi:DNA-binding CsgD family transcriptional regulator